MGKFIKVCLILAAAFFVGGIGCVVASLAMGTGWNDFKVAAQNGELDFFNGHIGFWSDDWEKDWENTQGHELDETEKFADIRNLKIELPVGELLVKTADNDEISLTYEGSGSNYKVHQSGNTLKIRGIGKASTAMGSLVIYIPKDYTFDSVEISVGAGNAEIETISARDADISVEAGQIKINELCIGEDASLSCEMGNIEVTLKDDISNYTCTAECDMGNLTIAGRQYRGMGNEAVIGNGDKTIEAECSFGNIVVRDK